MSTNKKITELAELAEAELSDDDVLPIVDISNNSTKKVRKSTLTSALAGVSTITATSPLAVNQNTGAVTISTGTIPINKGGTGQTTASAALAALGGLSDPTTTRGDILTRGASALGRLGLGTANYVLKSSGTDPEWGQVSVTELTGVLATAKGGTGLSAIGTAGQVLTVNSGASGLEWGEGVVSGTVTLDRFSGTGSQTAFTLSQAPDNENFTQVYISGVYQQKNTYSVSGTTLTFTTAPPSGLNNIEVTNTGASFFGVSPSIGTVTTGAAGSSASVSITSGGVMSFTIPRGDTGAAGAAGAAATIAVGSTTTGNAGTSASVSNSGSSSAATFNFTIPKGDTGATGATGAAGAAATIAAGSATGLAAGASPTVTNAGSSSAATFNFGIPAGAAATIAAGSATGLAAGASPTVTNAGSSSAATFNFGIPAGATGATGSTGTAATIAAGSATGLAAGASPTVTNAGSSSAATFNFGIPAGATGAAGSAATIAVGTVTTGAAGSSATVTNVGSSSAATFNFSIPQGAAGTGSGDVVGPASSTDNAIARFDATTGKLLQNSTITVSDTGTFSTGTNANLELDPNGSGKVVFKGNATKGSGQFVLNCEQNSHGVTLKGPPHSAAASYTLTLPNDDGSADQVLKTDGSGTLAWADRSNVTLAGSLDYLTISGQEITRGAIVLTTDVSGTLPIANGGTNATSAGAALTSLGAAASGANSDITSLTGLTTDLTVAQGGTGAGTFTANGVLVGNGTSAVTATAVGTSGHVLTSNGSGSAPTFQAAGGGGGGATDINGLSDALTNSNSYTIGLGNQALVSDDGSANNNIALGGSSLANTTSGEYNTAIGSSAGTSNTTGEHNTFLGANNATVGTLTGDFNTGIGSTTLRQIQGAASDNIGCGYWSGYALTTGSTNIMLGRQAMYSATTAANNVAIGREAGGNVTTASSNVMLGFYAGSNTTVEDSSVFIGNQAGKGTAGTTSYGYNVAIGIESLYSHNGVYGNVAIGAIAGKLITTGLSNTTIGYLSGEKITTGSSNTCLGFRAGDVVTTGTANTILGYNADASSATVSNEITLGNSNVSTLRCQVQTISSLSDRRDKKDIEELPLGIDFINTLKPVKFTWNMRDGAKVGEQEAGFIAQDLDKAQIDADAEDYLSLVLKSNPEKLEASYGKLVPVLVKAVQELSAEVATLKKEIKNG